MAGVSPGRGRQLGRGADQVATDVVLLDEHLDPHASPAGIEDGLGDGARVDLLDRDVESPLRSANEVDDDLLKVVCGAERDRPDVCVDLAVAPATHGVYGRTSFTRSKRACGIQQHPPRNAVSTGSILTFEPAESG